MKFKRLLSIFQLSLLLVGLSVGAVSPIIDNQSQVAYAASKDAKSSDSKKTDSKSSDAKSSSSSSSSSSNSVDPTKGMPTAVKKVATDLKSQNNLMNDDMSSAAQQSILKGAAQYNNKVQLLMTYGYLMERYGSGSNYSTLYSNPSALISSFNSAAPGVTFPQVGSTDLLDNITNSDSSTKNAQATKAENIAASAYPTDQSDETKMSWIKKNNLGQMAMKVASPLAANAVKAISVSDSRHPLAYQMDYTSKDDGPQNWFAGLITSYKAWGYKLRGIDNGKTRGNWNAAYFIKWKGDGDTGYVGSHAKGSANDKTKLGNLIGTSSYVKGKQSNIQGLIAIGIMDGLANKGNSIKSKSQLQSYLSGFTAEKYGNSTADGNDADRWQKILSDMNKSPKYQDDGGDANADTGISYYGVLSEGSHNQDDTTKAAYKLSSAILPGQVAGLNGGRGLGAWGQNYSKYMLSKENTSVSDNDWKTFQDFAKQNAQKQTQASNATKGNNIISWSPVYPHSDSYSKSNTNDQNKSSANGSAQNGIKTDSNGAMPMRVAYFFMDSQNNPLYQNGATAPQLALGGDGKNIITDGESIYNFTNASQKSALGDHSKISNGYSKAYSGSVDSLSSSNNIVGLDSYGNIIDGQGLKVIIPYWQNTTLKKFDSNPIVKTNSHDFGLGNGTSGESNTSDDAIKALVGSGTPFDLAKKAREALNSSDASGSQAQENAAVNKAVGDNSGSTLSNKAAAGLAILIVAKDGKAVQDFNKSFVSSSAKAKQLYVGKSDTQSNASKKSQSKGNSLYTATDIIQRIGLQTDYGSFDQLRKTIVTMVVSTYDSEFLRNQTQNVFATDTFGSGDEIARYGLAPYFLAMIFIETIIAIVTGFQYWMGKVKFSTFFTRTAKFIIVVIAVSSIHMVEEIILNKPTEWAIQTPLKQQSVVDQWSKLKQEQEVKNIFYASLFQNKSDQINNSADYMIPFYTSTLKNGQVDTSVSDPMQNNNQNQSQGSQLSGSSVTNSAAYKYGDGKVPMFTNLRYKTVNVTLADLTSWASHMARQIYSAQGKTGFQNGQANYEAPADGYEPGKEPLFAWLANNYQPIGSPGQENSGKNDQDHGTDDDSPTLSGGGSGSGTSTGKSTGTGTGNSSSPSSSNDSGNNVTAPKSSGSSKKDNKVTMSAKPATKKELKEYKAATKKQSYKFNDIQVSTNNLTYNPNSTNAHITYLASKSSSKTGSDAIKKGPTVTFNIPSNKKDTNKKDTKSDSSGNSTGNTNTGDAGGSGNSTGTGTGNSSGNGGTGAGTDGTDDGSYGYKRNPADTSIKSAYENGVTGNAINNAALYKNFNKYSEFAVNTKHYAKSTDIAYGVDMNSDGGKLTASQAFLKIWMQIFANSGDGGNPGDANSLNSLMNFAQALNGNMGDQTTSNNVGQDNDGTGTTLENVGQTGRNDLINELSMTSKQRTLMNGNAGFSQAAQNMISTFQIPAGKSDYFNFDSDGSIIDTMAPYLYKNTKNRDGLIFDLNKAMLNDYVSDYSVVRAEIDPSGANSSSDSGNNQGTNASSNVDPFTMAEDQIMAVDAFFRVNQQLHYSMFPTGYEPNSVSLDTWNRMLFIPIGVMNNLSSNDQYNDTDNTNASPVNARDNVAEFLSLNTSLISLFAFILMNYLLIAFGMITALVFKFVFPIVVVLSIIRNFISTGRRSSLKGLLQGSLGLIIVFGVIKFGLVELIAYLSKTMNNNYIAAGGYTSLPVGSHSMAVITYLLVVTAFIVKIYAPFVAKDVLTFGGQDGGYVRNLAGMTGHKLGSPFKRFNTRGIAKAWKDRRQARHERNLKRGIGRSSAHIRGILNGARHPINTTVNKIRNSRAMAKWSNGKSFYKHNQDSLYGQLSDLKNSKYGGVDKTDSHGLDIDKLNNDNISNGDHIDDIAKGAAAFDLGSKATGDMLNKIINDKKITGVHTDGDKLIFDNINSSMLNTAGGRKEMFDNLIHAGADELDKYSDYGNGEIAAAPKNAIPIKHDSNGNLSINVDSKNGIDPEKLAQLTQSPFLSKNFDIISTPNVHDGKYTNGQLRLAAKPGNDINDPKRLNELQSRINHLINRKEFNNKYNSMIDVGGQNNKEQQRALRKRLANGMVYTNGKILYDKNNSDQRKIAETLSNEFKQQYNNHTNGLTQFVEAGHDYVVGGNDHGFNKPNFTSSQRPGYVTQRFKTNNNRALADGLQGLSRIAQNAGVTSQAYQAQARFNQAMLNHFGSPRNMLDAYADYAHRNHMRLSQDSNNLMRQIQGTLNNYGPVSYDKLDRGQKKNIERLMGKFNKSLEDNNQLNAIQNGVSSGLDMPESQDLSAIRKKLLKLSGSNDSNIFNKMTVGQIGNYAAQAASMKNMQIDRNGILTGDIPQSMSSQVGQQRVTSLIRALTQ